SELDKFVAEQLVQGVDHAKSSSARVKQAAEIMRGWDGRMMADSAAPALAYKARAELSGLLLKGKLGASAADINYRWGMQSVWLENVLRERPARWLPENYASYDELLAAAVEATVKEPNVPQDLRAWKWGEVNALEIQHPVLGRIPLLQRWTG